MVFAHFIVGITGNRASAADYDDDMKRAKAVGIDAFAFNIGNESPEVQLGFAYDSAAANGMKAFISFDCNFFKPGEEGKVGALIAQFASKPAQLKVGGGKTFVSTFIGDGLNVAAIRAASGGDIFFVPNFHPGQADFAPLDGAFNFQGWPSNGLNKAPSGGKLVTVDDGDKQFQSLLAGKSYMAPVSPWFSTHFGGEVPFSKNWVFPSELLIYQRWLEILALKPSFAEIVTWNDYGESHYIGPLASKHTDDGASKWANDMPHNGWTDLSKPFIAAYKAGESAPDKFIDEEKIIYWYRITPKGIDCDSTDTTFGPGNNATGDFFNGRPNGFETLSDNVFVVSLLKSPGTVTVNSGGTLYTFDAPAGASAFSAPFKVGAQAFALQRDGKDVMAATSLKVIQDTCPCGIYNFNAYVGTVPEGTRDTLQPGDALANFKSGLKVACDAVPSLPATPPATAAPTATSSVTAAPTSPPI
ncbi:glycoside hydrolase family 71 protein [Marasmius fiardii PR-910]|nr:glycoside hydrolase family 71 protein [Marasmius fiardii PR-910]